MALRKPGYREACEWLAGNDDCHEINEWRDHGLSVAMSMVRDLWGVSEERLVKDIKRWLARIHPDHPALRSVV